jgi:glycosyltransferase involved in cell wall biosynthesis
MKPALRRAGVRDDHLAVIDNGIDTQRFRPGQTPLDLRSLGLPEGCFVFGSAMRLCDVKNPLGLVEAFAAASTGLAQPCALLLAGDGPLRPALEARIAAHGLQRQVRLLGALPDLSQFYAALHAFVLPSLSEGLPLALLEAMASELPVLASEVGEVPQVLAGLGLDLLPPGDVPALAQALRVTVMARPGPQTGLRARVLSRYSVARMAAEYAAVYQRLRHRTRLPSQVT